MKNILTAEELTNALAEDTIPVKPGNKEEVVLSMNRDRFPPSPATEKPSAEPSPKQFLMIEAASVRKQLATTQLNRARLLAKYHANTKRIEALRAELAELGADQARLKTHISANDKAAAIQRKAIFELEEAAQ